MNKTYEAEEKGMGREEMEEGKETRVQIAENKLHTTCDSP